jgi:hypothetical protein
VDGAASDGYTGYLCCLPGQIGVQGNVDTVGQSAICVDQGTPFAQSASGTLVSSSEQCLEPMSCNKCRKTDPIVRGIDSASCYTAIFNK